MGLYIGSSNVAGGGSVTDSSVAAFIGAGGPTDTALSATYATVRAGGNRVVFLGDSQTVGSDVPSVPQRNSSWPNYAAIQSKQQINYVYNAGVSGNTSAQMIARFASDVAPHAPAIVTLLAGRNDINNGLTLATYQTNIAALVGLIRGIGALPVLCTVPPTSGTYLAQTAAWNHWLRAYAQANSIPLLDFYSVLVDPATGSYLAAYDSGDHVHPNAAGYFALGTYAAAKLAPILPPYQPVLPMDVGDTANLVVNSCFTNTTLNGNGEPSGFFVANPTGTTNTIVTGDTTIKGNWIKMAVAAPASQVQLYKTGYAVVVGHTYAFTGLVKNALTAGSITAAMTLVGTSPASRYAFYQELNALNGQFYTTFTVPTGVTSLQIQFTIAAGSTGNVQLAQIGAYDLTTLGADGLA